MNMPILVDEGYYTFFRESSQRVVIAGGWQIAVVSVQHTLQLKTC